MSVGILDEAPRQFDLPQALRRRQWGYGLGAFAAVGLLVAAMIFEGEVLQQPTLLALSAGLIAIFSGIGLQCLHVARTRSYAIEIGRDGVRPIAGGTAAWVSWAEIAELRERPLLYRIELCSPGGTVRARLEYQLEDFDEALAAVVARVRPAPHLETRGPELEVPLPPGRMPVVAGTVAASSALVFWKLGGAGLYTWLALPFTMAVAAAADRFLVTRRVEVRNGRLLLYARLRRTEIDLAEVTDTRLRVRDIGNGVKRLDLELRFASGKTRFIRPGAANPFALKRLIDPALSLR